MRFRTVAGRSTMIALCAACAVTLFAISLFLQAYGSPDRSARNSHAAGTYSLSAIGSAGFYDMLRRMDMPVVRSVGRTHSTVGNRGTLVIAEPEARYVTIDNTTELFSPRRILLVLSKWRGTPQYDRPTWIESAAPLPIQRVEQTLSLVAPTGNMVVRSPWPFAWTTNDIGITPTSDGFIQLMHSELMTPIVASGDAILLGEIQSEEQTIWVLSDPDVMSNHGIVRGNNAQFMLALIEALRFIDNTDAGAPIVFDETIHGFRAASSSPFRMLLRFPLVIVTFLIACTFSLLIWSGAGRFGRPVRPEPAHDFGKWSLISNAARLLDYSGHHAAVLERYIRMVIRSAADALHIPQTYDVKLAAELDRIARSRGVEDSCSSILEASAGPGNDEASLKSLLAQAKEIHRWKEVLLNGPGTDSENGRIGEKRGGEDRSRTE